MQCHIVENTLIIAMQGKMSEGSYNDVILTCIQRRSNIMCPLWLNQISSKNICEGTDV